MPHPRSRKDSSPVARRAPKTAVADAKRDAAAAARDGTIGTRTGLAANLLFALCALLFLGAGLRADPRTWGVHALAFLPRSAWLAAAAGMGLLAIPRPAAWLGGLAGGVGARLRSPWLPIGVALTLGVLFASLRLQAQLLGDGVVWLEKLRTRSVFHHFEPLATALVRAVALQSADPERAAGLASVGLGVVYVWGTGLLCRALWPESSPARGLAWSLLLASPVLLLFFGYVESYPVLIALQALCALSLVLSARRRLHPVVPAAIAAVAVGSHLQAVAWMPALVVLPLVRARVSNERAPALRPGLAGAGLACGSLVLAMLLVRGVGASPRSLAADLLGDSGLGSMVFGWFFSATHAVDLANELLLLLCPLCLLLAGTLPRRVWRRAGDPAWVVLAALLPGPLLFLLVVRPRIGGARDWDLYVSILLPCVLLAVETWRRSAQAVPRRGLAALSAGRSLGLALAVTLAWLGVNLDSRRAAQRLLVLQQPGGTFSNFARGYANEALGIYWRDRDVRASRDAYERAVQANPGNPRYLNNLGNTELRLRHIPAARAAYDKALALGMREWPVLYNLGLCELQQHQPESAELLFEEIVKRWPDNWAGYAGRGQALLDAGRSAQALLDLERAAQLHPEDSELHYLMGIALRDLGRSDDARSALQRTLRLDPKHERARRALQRLDDAQAKARP